MNTIKKIIVLVLSLSIISICTIPLAYAEKDVSHQTGLIWDTWEDYLNNLSDTTLRALACQRSGDVDADGKITASDARLCIRSAAKLEELTEPQRVAADVDESIDITSADARKILRAAAKLDVLEDMSIEASLSWGFVLGALENSGSGKYYWQCSIDSDGLAVTQKSIDESKELDGASPENYFVFTPEKAGKYTVTLILADSKQEEILEKFKISVIVNESGITLPCGESYSFEGLKNAGSGRYNWKCTVEPENGIEVTEKVVSADNPAEGTPIEQIFTFTGTKTGVYTAHFELIASGEAVAINEFYLDIAIV